MAEVVNESILTALLAKAKPVVVICFFSSECALCKEMIPHINTVSLCFTGVTFLRIDVDKDQALAAAFKINKLPYFVTFKENIRLKEISTTCVSDFVKELKSCIAANQDVVDLVFFIDRKNVQTENCYIYEGFCMSLFQGQEHLESDDGSEIILSIPFKEEVSITDLIVQGPKLNGPKLIFVYKNVKKSSDLETELEILVPTQIIEVTPKQLLGLESIKFDRESFLDVVKIVMLVKNSQTSASIIRIDKLCFKGTKNFHQNRKLVDIENRYGLIEKQFGIQWNIKREEKHVVQKDTDLIVIIPDTNVTMVPLCQRTILDIEARCEEEKRMVRFIFPYMMLDELQLTKDLAIPEETVEEKDLRRMWENASARFILNSIKKENYFIQSKSMMNKIEQDSDRPSLTVDESIIRCAVQQKEFSSENSRCLILTFDRIAQLFSFGHMIFSYDCNGVRTLLDEKKLSIDDILLTNEKAAESLTMSAGYTEKLFFRRCMRFMEDTMDSVYPMIESLWNLKKIISNSPTFLCMKENIHCSFREKITRLKEKHIRLLKTVIYNDKNISIESKRMEMIKEYQLLWDIYYDLEHECVSDTCTTDVSKEKNIFRVNELKDNQSRLLLKLDERGVMEKCSSIKMIPYNLGLDSPNTTSKKQAF